MGAWGVGPFENDRALDFLAETTGSAGALASALQPRSFISTSDGEVMVAACELIALALDGANEATPPKARELAATLAPADSLRTLAVQALQCLRDPETSELAELWKDAPDFDALLVETLERLGVDDA